MNFQDNVKDKLINKLTKGKGKSMNLKKMFSKKVIDVSKIETIKEIREIYFKAQDGSKNQEQLFDRWNQLSLEEVKAAQTYDQARDAYSNAPEGSTAETAASDKMKEFSK